MPTPPSTRLFTLFIGTGSTYTVTVTSPTSGGTVYTAAMPVAWTISSILAQQAYRVTIYSDALGTDLVYDSGIVTSSAQTHIVPYGVLETETSYWVRVESQDTAGATGQSSLVQFTTAFTPQFPVTGLTLKTHGGDCGDPNELPNAVLSWLQPSLGRSAILFANPLTKNNVVTDAMRAAAAEGDGRTSDATYGIYNDGNSAGNLEGTHNAGDPSHETGVAGYTTGGTNTLAFSTEQAKFATHSAKVTYSNNLTLHSKTVTLAAARHAASRWIYIPSTWNGGTISLQAVNFAGITGTTSVNANMALTNQWQELRLNGFIIAGGDLTGDIAIIAASAPSVGRTVYVDGCGLYQVGIAPPFELGNRTNQRIQADASLLSADNCWMIFRFRAGAGSGETVGANRYLLSWGAAGESVHIFNTDASTTWTIRREHTSVNTDTTFTQAYSRGDVITLAVIWRSDGSVSVSWNGAALTTTTHVGIQSPQIPQTSFDIGSAGTYLAGAASNQLCGELMWIAIGENTALTNSDVSAASAFSNTAKTIPEWNASLPTTLITGMIPFTDGSYYSGAADTFVEYNIKRKGDDEDSFTRIGVVSTYSTLSFTDTLLNSGHDYEYGVTVTVYNGTNYLTSLIQAASLRKHAFLKWDFIFLHEIDNPTNYIRLFSYQLRVTTPLDIKFQPLWGRTHPTAFVGEQAGSQIAITGLEALRNHRQEWERLMTIFKNQRDDPSVLCLRLGLDRELYYVQQNNLGKAMTQKAYTTDAQFMEVEYTPVL